MHKEKNQFQKSDSSTINDEEKNVRQSEILRLYSKGFTQTEIAQVLKVNQSTISRDLKEIKKESRKYIENIIAKEIPFQFSKTLTGLDEIIKSSWKIIDDNDNINSQKVSVKEKYDILNLLESLYFNRLRLIIGGDPKTWGESAMNLINSIRSIKYDEKHGFGI